MAENGNRPAVRISQKRLTIVITVLGLLGCIVLGLAWWDSTMNFTRYSAHKGTIFIFCSSVYYTPVSQNPKGSDSPYYRESADSFNYVKSPIFPLPEITHDQIIIPIYLLILTYVSTHSLIWIVLMNRLARRHFKNTTSNPTQD